MLSECFPFNSKRFKIEVTYYLVFVFSFTVCSLPHFSKVPGFDYGCISDLADCNNERETLHFLKKIKETLTVFLILILAFLFLPVPASIGPLNDLTVTKGQTISLFCNVSGQPAPNVSWTHVNTRREFSDATWNITITDERNLGDYRCDASNLYGSASITISVVFPGK